MQLLKIPYLKLFPRKGNAILVRIEITQGFLENCKTVRKMSKALTDTLNSFAKQILEDIKLRATFQLLEVHSHLCAG